MFGAGIGFRGVLGFSVRAYGEKPKRLPDRLPPAAVCEQLESRTLLSVSAAMLVDAEMVAGNTYTYNYTETSATGTITATLTEEVVGPATFNGASATQLNLNYSNVSGSVVPVEEEFRGFDSAGDYVDYGQMTTSGGNTVTDTFSPYQVNIPASLTAGGAAVNSSDSDMETLSNAMGVVTETNTDSESIQTSLAAGSPGSVTVPAGTFSNAYDIQTVQTTIDPDSSDNGDVGMSDSWVVPGVGLVKFTSSNIANGVTTDIELTSDQVSNDHLVFSVPPSDADAGATIDPAVTVSLVTPAGDIDTGANGDISVALGDGAQTGVLSGTLTQPIDNGQAVFDDLSINNPGDYSLTASSTEVPDSITSDLFTIGGSNLPATTTTLKSAKNPANSGQAVKFTATVTSHSGHPTGTVAFFDSSTQIGVATLSGGSAAFTDSSLAGGAHSIIAAYEGDPQFGASVSSALTENIAGGPAVLTPALGKITLPNAIVSGTKINATANVDVMNTGTGSSSGTFNVNVYAAPTQTFNSSTATSIGSVNKSTKIKNGGSSSVPVKLTVPALASGSYYLIAVVTDASGNANSVASSQPITIAAPFINLSDQSSPLKATVKKNKISAVVTVINEGNIAADGPLEIDLDLSPNSDGSSPSPVTVVTKTIHLKPGATEAIQISATVPSAIAAGSYFAVATCDPGNTFSETTLADNTVVSALEVVIT